MINGIDAVGVDKQVKQVFSFPVLFLLIAISMIIPLARTILYIISSKIVIIKEARQVARLLSWKVCAKYR